MADVTVFVDDAVLGRLPPICARDGVPTTSRLRISEEIGRAGLGILWLLIFAGPFGWIVLAFCSLAFRGEQLSVELPFSEAAHRRLVEARRLRYLGIVTGIVVVPGLLFLTARARLGPSGIILTAVAAAVAGGVVLTGMWRMAMASVSVGLDASRRWVSLRGVHPTFATACQDQRRRQYSS